MGSISKDSGNLGNVKEPVPHPPPCSPCCQCCHKWMDSYPILITELLSRFTQRLEHSIEERFQKAVDKLVHSSCSRSVPHDVRSSASRSLKLRFVGTLPDELATFENISDESAPLLVELLDSSGSKVEVGPESSLKIKILVLDGDFEVEDSDDWTAEEFEEKVARERKGKPPLLKGKSEILMKNGVAMVNNDNSITDNSKCVTKNGWFRLGAKVVKGAKGVEVREAVSEAFQVKESRGRRYKKQPKTLSLKDGPERLKHIGKNLAEKLETKDICTVQDFLRLYHTDEQTLKDILRLSDNKWSELRNEAMSCPLTKEVVRYTDNASGVELEMDCVFHIKAVTLNGGITKPYAALDNPLKELVDRIRINAYEKLKNPQESHNPILMVPKQDDVGSIHPTGQYQGILPLSQCELRCTSTNTHPSGQRQGMERRGQDMSPNQTHQELHEKANQVQESRNPLQELPPSTRCPSTSPHADKKMRNGYPIIMRGHENHCIPPYQPPQQEEEEEPPCSYPQVVCPDSPGHMAEVEQMITTYENAMLESSYALPDPLPECFSPVEEFIDHICPPNDTNNGQDPPQNANVAPKDISPQTMDEDSEFNSSFSQPHNSNQPFNSGPTQSSRKRPRTGLTNTYVDQPFISVYHDI